MKTILPVLFFLGISCLTANTLLTTSVSCARVGYADVSDPSSCLVGIPPVPNVSRGAYAAADSYANLNLSGSSSGWVVAQVGGFVAAIPDLNLPGGTFATSNATLHADLTTNGPVRPGYLEAFLTVTGGGAAENFYAGTSYSFGPVSGGCGGFDVECSGRIVPTGFPTLPMAFTLGTPFPLDAGSALLADTTALNGAATGSLSTTVEFRLFEQDGVTPVTVVNAPTVPEPGTLWLGLGCVGFLFCRRKAGARRIH